MAETGRIIVNGVARLVEAEPPRSLLTVLRDELGLTGAKLGCGEGECGACTVLADGDALRSCHVYASEVFGQSVTTIEALDPAGNAGHAAQRAFLEANAFQCGYCTPGFVMATAALLANAPRPDDATMDSALAKQLCRCGTYPRIRRAIHRAAELAAESHAVGTSPGVARGRRDSPVLPVDRWPRPRRPWDLARPRSRDWFAVLPDGLVAVAPPGGGRSHPGAGGWTATGGAWVHVGTDGRVTAFTGKVDIGQDNRTALSLLVAEELRVPLDAVELVMGDTDVCPYDLGTFGSRSTPDAGEVLAIAAATARDALVRLASEQWEVATGDLTLADGTVRTADGSRAVAFGELVAGGQRVATAGVEVATGAPTVGRARRLAGRSAARVTGPAIVSGARRYTSDLVRPGMVHGRVLRAPAFGARLRSVDTSKARALPGVTVVEDGDFVGVVVADPLQAGRAIRSIEAEWDHEPGPSEPELEAWLRTHPAEAEGWAGAVDRETGDVERALAVAPARIAATYTTAFLAHAPLETTVAIAEWSGSRLTVWATAQQPFGVREDLAASLGSPESAIRVIVPDTGGGFGGRHGGTAAIEAARLSRAVGQPVRVAWSRREEFALGHFRPAAVIDVRSGGSGRGRDAILTAWELRNINSGPQALAGPYRVANQRLVFQPADSPLPQGPFRALAATANTFARESNLDELAHALGADPFDFRLRHLDDDRLGVVLRAAAEQAGWPGASMPRRAGQRVGMGIACGVEKGARVASCVSVRVDHSGRLGLERIVTAVECGAIVNPDGLVNQVEGATVMGLGAALFEAVHFEAGVIRNGTFKDYRMARIGDVPPIEVVLVDRPDLPSAGCGETPIIAVAPALANAIFAASGSRLRSLPLVPDGVVG